jgi:hypothetical protein
MLTSRKTRVKTALRKPGKRAVATLSNRENGQGNRADAEIS